MSIRTNYHQRSTTPAEASLYAHLLDRAAHGSPKDLIHCFQSLFIEGSGYSNREVVAALDTIVDSPDVDQYFHFILNRCCHILINRWQSQPQLQQAIPELLQCFEHGPARPMREPSRSRSARRLRRLSQNFRSTEQYSALRRLAWIVTTRQRSGRTTPTQPLGTLINRYPYLYEHCLLTEDSGFEHHQHVRRMQSDAQNRFEVALSHYVTYRVRCARQQNAARLQPLENPTLLNDRQLVTSLQQFSRNSRVGYQEQARQFTRCSGGITYGAFKANLYDYLCSGIDPSYGRQQFNLQLGKRLQHTFPGYDEEPLTDFLTVRTCSQLLNFLIIDTSANKQHYLFIDLINNLGPLLTIGLLLRLLLVCRKVKPHLERRFSVLFNHYETATQETVAWLVNVFENLNIALSLNFGSLDVSHMTLG